MNSHQRRKALRERRRAGPEICYHAWVHESGQVPDGSGGLKFAEAWICWSCGAVSETPPVGTFMWMAGQVAKPGMGWNEIGHAVERKFYGIEHHES